MNLQTNPQVLCDGRCAHCYTACDTGGCITCGSSRTYCTCGALLRCGCGMVFEHDPQRCPNFITPVVIALHSPADPRVTLVPIEHCRTFPVEWKLV